MSIGQNIQHSLMNLLAIIHRDGGHYVSEHGLLKAIEDAEEKVKHLHNVIAKNNLIESEE